MYSDRMIPVELILSSNVPVEYDTELMKRYKGTLEVFIGPVQTLVFGNTLQVSDYERYNWTMFNAEEKKVRRKIIFPQECQAAYQLGADMIKAQ